MEKETRRVSVRDMVEQVLLAGDLSRASSAARMLEGMRGHQKLQAHYGDRARSEVALAQSVKGEHIELTVHGRADVVWMQEDTPIAVEEIKTTRRDPHGIGVDDYPLHWAQAECYGHMLCAEGELPAIEIVLTYAAARGEAVARFSRMRSAQELAESFARWAGAYLAEIEAQLEREMARDGTLRTLPFPYAGFRPGQKGMVRLAFLALRDGRGMLCEAPTGIGKTSAMLYAALKAMGEGMLDKIFYLTARGTTQGVAKDALATMRRAGLKVRSITLAAKEKLCPAPGTPCNAQDCPLAQGYYDKLGGALKVAHTARDDYDAEFVREIAMEHQLCPFELSLDLSLACDVIIGDYNYAFDPKVRLKRYFMEKSKAALLVDEAHNLPSRARAMFSAMLSRKALTLVRREEGRKSRKTALYKSLSAVLAAMKELGAQGERLERTLPKELLEATRAFCDAASEAMEQEEAAASLVDAFFAGQDFVQAGERAKAWEREYVLHIEADEVTLRCLQPAPFLKEVWAKVRAGLLFSATMMPLAHYQDMAGMDAQAEKLRLPSPFPPEHLRTLLMPQSVLYRDRERTAGEVAGGIAALCDSAPCGNYLAFFPSYAYLRQIMPLVEALLPNARHKVQQMGMNDAAREEFLEAFEENPRGVLVGYGVLGGLFGEGIDLPGGRLSGCAIVGVGLPQIGPQGEALRAYFDEEGADGFARAYVYPGMARVVQAAGRVIRSPQDKGALLLIDQRFGWAQYAHLLPPWWRVQRVRGAQDVREQLAAFWAEG